MNLKLISLWWVLIWADADEDCVAVADKDRVYVTKLISPSLSHQVYVYKFMSPSLCHQVYVTKFMSLGFRYINCVTFATTRKRNVSRKNLLLPKLELLIQFYMVIIQI